MNLAIADIPAELRAMDNWVLWRMETRDGQATKVPFQANGRRASSTAPSTWTTFGQAIEADGFDGIGMVFHDGCGLIGIDLDNAVNPDGSLKPWGRWMVDRFDTYTEVSPSGLGVKLWLRGTYPGPKTETGKRVEYRDGKVEMYWKGRYFTVTALHLPGTPTEIRENQDAIDGLYRKILNPEPVRRRNVAVPDVMQRCIRYIERCPDAISGEGGHDRTLRVACECFRFGLSPDEAGRVLDWYSETKCNPPWTRRELDHKITDALTKVREAGEFGMRVRAVEEPRVPISVPPADTSDLHRVIAETIDGKRSSIAFPWRTITQATKALMPGTITILTGMGGSSKSLMVSEMCLYWLSVGVPFAVFHLEEDREYHQMRALAQLEGRGVLTDDEWMREHSEESLEAYDKHAGTLAALGASIWDAPQADVSLVDLVGWIRERTAEGRRVLVIDPVTAADSGDKPWLADRRFVLNAKRVLREAGASLIVVTHPRNADPKGSRLDNHAGGQAYNRFAQTVLSLTACAPKTVRTVERTAFGTRNGQAEVNRVIHVHKARNGWTGLQIGYWFNSATLRFVEHGGLLDG